MKKLIVGMALYFFLGANVPAQIVNGSFELNDQPSLEGWQNYGGQSHHEAPPGGGEWSLEISGGCVWGYVYQNLPHIKNNEIWRLSCWARRIDLFGGGHIAWWIPSKNRSLKDAWLADSLWSYYSVVDTFLIEETDTIAVLLEGGGGIVGCGGAYFDLVEVEKIGVISLVINEASGLPQVFALRQNYPNPFNITTLIRYILAKPSFVTLEIYNLLGERMRTLITERKPAGSHHKKWDGKDDSGQDLGSGVYFCRFHAGEIVEGMRMVLLR